MYADGQSTVTTDMVDNRCVNVRASDPLGARVYKCAVGNDGNVGRPTANVHDRGSVRVIYSDTCTKGCGQALLHHEDATDTCVVGSAEQCTPLNLRDARIYAHQRATTEKRDPAACLAHEIRQHLLRSFKVRDDPVKQGSDDHNIAGLASVHLLRLEANSDHLSGDGIDGDQGWLIDHDAAAAHIDDGRRRSHVYCHRIGNQISKSSHTLERRCLAH